MELNKWVKAERSSNNGQCVEVMKTTAGYLIRDSKDPQGPVLAFTADEFAAFTHGASNGEFA